MATKLTDEIARTHPAPTARAHVIVYDTEVKGFGLRVTAGGARAFVLNYRSRGVERRLTIGAYPTWKVAGARKRAAELKRLVDQGRDPMGERHAERAAPTMKDLGERYLAEHAAKKRTAVDDRAMVETIIIPALGSRKVADVRHADVDELHRAVTKRGAPIRANRVVALLSKMFSLAIKWEMRADNPAKGVERNPETRRARYLTPLELVRLTRALDAHQEQPSAAAVRLLLLTGARRGEVLGAAWEQFDLAKAEWVKPSSHTKQKKEHRVTLSAPARLVLAGLKAKGEAEAKAAGREPSPLVFPSRNGRTPQRDLKRFWATICREAELDGVRVHDLRHTAASILVSAGLSLPTIGAVLGHTQPQTTHRYAHLFKDALQAATDRLGDAVAPPERPRRGRGKVVAMKRAR